MIMNLHTHTHNSYDGADETVAERIAAAKALGLQYLAVTDHVEVNRYFHEGCYENAVVTEEFQYNFSEAYAASVYETSRAQQTCEGLRLLCGVELGQIPQAPEISQVLYNDPRIDLVVGSIHELPGMADFYFLDYSRLDIPALMHAYFAEELKLAESGLYDVLAHLTYGLRYLPNRAGYDLTPHLPEIDAVFRAVIAQGKALELNGSGLKSDPSYTDPDISLIRRFRELGGQYLTISNDAHENAHLGIGIDALEDMARAAGFTHLTYFERHQPNLIPL